MSAVPRFQTVDGVLLDYGDPGAKHPYHEDNTPKVTDQQRADLVAAETMLCSLRLMFECCGFPEITLRRVDLRIEGIRRSLDWQRVQFGLTPICLGEIT